ncbi:MAG: FtsQ-type POTRA domain-containing protein [Ruminococcus sp.]|nr:FtsQ-type POTRA domain-containing protein [Ruminococcus sp.]
MNDVEKTLIERQNSGKRIRRRKRMMNVYAFTVIIIVLTIGVTMCFTFLFNIDKIIVSGESEDYTSLQIVEASEINAGDNMLRLDARKAEQNILDKLTYVETAEVGRDFPSTLKITVTRCIPGFNIRYDGGVLLVSRKGKILSDGEVYTDIENIPIISGYMPSEKSVGKMTKSESSDKDAAFAQILKRFENGDGKNISSVDITNEYDIVVTYRNGMIFRMGNWSNMSYKLDLAESVMNDESIKGKKGYITMIGKNQCSFRGSGEQEIVTEAATTAATDETGQVVTETTATTAALYGF